MKPFICLHGHFYQPARENPWTGEVERDPSSAPAPDWNARITAECYEPNCQAAILDFEGALYKRVNNFERISFDFGPALLAWLARHEPAIYAQILTADEHGRERFGHGPALAHPPLLSGRQESVFQRPAKARCLAVETTAPFAASSFCYFRWSWFALLRRLTSVRLGVAATQSLLSSAETIPTEQYSSNGAEYSRRVNFWPKKLY